MTAPTSDHDVLVEVYTIVRRLDKAVMGNGQPGLVQDVAGMKARVTDMEADAARLRQVADAVPSKKRTALNTGMISGLLIAVFTAAREVFSK